MKFNLITKRKSTLTFNHAGSRAFKLTPEFELYSAVVTTTLSATFYESDQTRLKRITDLIARCNPEFVAKLAIYARTEMNLRTIPLVLVVELAKKTSGNSLIKKTVSKVVNRADEIAELLAYYQFANKRNGSKKLNKLSKQIQKGLGEAFNKFDEYQFAKYNRNTEVKLKDALFLVHPSPKDEAQQELFNKIASDSLATPYTWETELSQLGKASYYSIREKQKAVTIKWEELIESKKVGYMALLRNLRNILNAKVSAKHMELVCSYLCNENAVANSKQMPFRFLAAYRELKDIDSEYTSAILDALEEATMISTQNIKGFNFSTSVVVACDVSGSMHKAISPKSKILLYDIGLMLGMLLQSRCKNVTSGMFGDTWKVINMPKRSILSNVNEYYRRSNEVGFSTNGHKVIKSLLNKRKVVDKVMLFTDMQLWNSHYNIESIANVWKRYKRIAPDAKLYLFDLAGHGNTPISAQKQDVYLIAGWSNKVFDMLHAMDSSKSVIAEIKKIEI